MTQSTFEVLKDRLDDAIKWVESQNIAVNNTRIKEYANTVSHICTLVKEKQFGNYVDGPNRNKFLSTFYEADEFLEICEGLKILPRKTSLQKLSEYLSGPNSYAEEKMSSSSNHPRNIGFELYLESQLIKCEFELSHSDKEDVAIEYKGDLILFECKRPQSEKKVPKRISEAVSQLKDRYQNGRNDINKTGMFCLSLTKLFNPSHDFLRGKDQKDLYSYLDEYGNRFTKQFEKEWLKRANPKTIGGLAQLKVVTYLEDSGLFANYSYGMVFTKGKGSIGEKTVLEIHSRLNSLE